MALAVEQVSQHSGVRLMDPDEHHEEEAHPHGLGPEERGHMPDERRGAQRREADVLPEPRAQRQHDFLTRPVPLAESVRYRIAAQATDQLDRSRDQYRLPLQ